MGMDNDVRNELLAEIYRMNLRFEAIRKANELIAMALKDLTESQEKVIDILEEPIYMLADDSMGEHIGREVRGLNDDARA